MNKELIQKIIRCFIITLCFVGALTAVGIKEREIQQWAFMLALMVIFGLLLRNIWLTLFMGWTVFLFSFFKFETGMIYVTNIFFGCLLYYLVKVSFKKEHINFFINAVLWFAVLNIIYMSLQINNYDFIFNYVAPDMRNIGQITPNIVPTGFMGQKAVCGSFLALCVPLLASRASKWAILGAVGLFIPIYLSHATLTLWAGGIGLAFVLWYRLPKKIWFAIIAGVVLLCIFYYLRVEHFGSERIPLWKKALHDCIQHPITGWGLDSFRNTTSYKDFRYLAGTSNIDGVKALIWWDNPHNLLVSLFYEFGIIGLFLLGGYLRQCGIWFMRAVKSPNAVGLAGFIITAFLISQAHFIMFLVRTAVIIIIAAALYEVEVKDNA